MNIKVKPSHLRGTVSAPPSKSYAHRMIISAALASGESTVRGVKENEDILATLDCISELGAKYTYDGDTLKIIGVSGKPTGKIFRCRESGSTLRFLIPTALVSGGDVVFEGAPRLIERGVGIYEEIFSQKGISVKPEKDKITVSGKLVSGEYVLCGNISSQFVSGLMFALPMLEGDSVIKVLPPVESRGYIDVTLDVLRKFGVQISEPEENVFYVKGGTVYTPCDCTVEGDWSNGAALLAIGRLFGEVETEGLLSDSLQGDKICSEIFEKLESDFSETDISLCPDLGPVMFAFAAMKNGGVFNGTRRLKIKESDRAGAMKDELARFGIDVKVEENRVTVYCGKLMSPSEICDSHNDHRIVMALTILGLSVGCEISGAEAINKSYPEFFSVLADLGAEFEYDI